MAYQINKALGYNIIPDFKRNFNDMQHLHLKPQIS